MEGIDSQREPVCSSRAVTFVQIMWRGKKKEEINV
jgi:hypothetical protein